MRHEDSIILGNYNIVKHLGNIRENLHVNRAGTTKSIALA
jgi:hypothetical protein